MSFGLPPRWRARGISILKAIGTVLAVGLLIDFLPIDLAIVLVGFLALTAQFAVSFLRHSVFGARRKTGPDGPGEAAQPAMSGGCISSMVAPSGPET